MKRILTFSVFLITLLIFTISCCHCETEANLSTRKELLYEKLRAQGFTDEEVQRIFSDERVILYPAIIEKKGKNLDYFNRKFGLLTRKSIERGRKILTDNKIFLNKIEDQYGVEKEVLVAIFRVETNFGQYCGHFPVFNSLLTMTLLENRRSVWAEQELIHLLILSRMNKIDPLTIKGSWAGAFGLCQFVPTSYLKHGVDGNGDGAINLFDFADAMASTANYLKNHGWETGDTEKMKKAIWAYNHCDNYIKAVLAYAKAIERGGIMPQKNRKSRSKTTKVQTKLLHHILEFRLA
ncbi:MAG: hypothetical protein C0392_05440 [Syntrophus sp. (in: bacteria)]|nr:hypothetical protein [Syntrophus sp. (in: bacteria)]